MTQLTQAGAAAAGPPPPAGEFVPSCEHLARALRALDRNRLEEAERATVDAPDRSLLARAWRRFLEARIALERVRLNEAARRLHESASYCHLAATVEDSNAIRADAMRLTALAWHHLGRVFRRQERIDDARNVHLAAWRLGGQFGSIVEQWHTAIELALDEELAQRWDDAERWCKEATALAHSTEQDRLRLAAEAASRLAAIRLQAGRLEQAVAAAEESLALWRRHDPACAEVAVAQARLAESTLTYGEELVDRGDPRASEVVASARRLLDDAADALLAFGGDLGSASPSCKARSEFAGRLLQSLR